jgi:general secretion pathway protein A
MFCKFFGLREQPFGVTPNPRYLYYGSTHRRALAALTLGIQNHLGFMALVAGPGTGKTTLLFRLLEAFRETSRTALVFTTQCD